MTICTANAQRGIGVSPSAKLRIDDEKSAYSRPINAAAGMATTQATRPRPRASPRYIVVS